MIKGKSTGTGFFCRINYENKDIPCLITSYQVLDDEYIKENKKIEISLNDNEINEDIILSEEDIIYISKENEYDLIIIKLKEETNKIMEQKAENEEKKKIKKQKKENYRCSFNNR